MVRHSIKAEHFTGDAEPRAKMQGYGGHIEEIKEPGAVADSSPFWRQHVEHGERQGAGNKTVESMGGAGNKKVKKHPGGKLRFPIRGGEEKEKVVLQIC